MNVNLIHDGNIMVYHLIVSNEILYTQQTGDPFEAQYDIGAITSLIFPHDSPYAKT